MFFSDRKVCKLECLFNQRSKHFFLNQNNLNLNPSPTATEKNIKRSPTAKILILI